MNYTIPGGIIDSDVLDILQLPQVKVNTADGDDVQRSVRRGVELAQKLSIY